MHYFVPCFVVEVRTVQSGNGGFVNVVVSRKSSPSNSGNSSDLLGMRKPPTNSAPGSPAIPVSPSKNQTVMIEGNVRNIPFQ